jgi:NAD(P)H-dependent FMN reductase
MILQVVITSTREQRAGGAVADWFVAQASAHGKFEVEVVDLAAVALPLLDEPNHPTKRQYQKAHTKAWSKIVAGADAFVFVVPEYNFGMPPALLNALDYLVHEWHYKPAAFVGYGGLSGGTRSIQMAKPVMTSLKIMPIPEAVACPFFAKQIDASGKFEGTDSQKSSATVMLDELVRWTEALSGLRAAKAKELA